MEGPDREGEITKLLDESARVSARLGSRGVSLRDFSAAHFNRKRSRHHFAPMRYHGQHPTVVGGDTLLPPGISERLRTENALDEELYNRARVREAERTERWRATCGA